MTHGETFCHRDAVRERVSDRWRCKETEPDREREAASASVRLHIVIPRVCVCVCGSGWVKKISPPAGATAAAIRKAAGGELTDREIRATARSEERGYYGWRLNSAQSEDFLETPLGEGDWVQVWPLAPAERYVLWLPVACPAAVRVWRHPEAALCHVCLHSVNHFSKRYRSSPQSRHLDSSSAAPPAVSCVLLPICL